MSSAPTSPLKQGHLHWPGSSPKEHPNHVQMMFLSISKNGDSTISLACQCWVTLTVEKCFLIFRGNLLSFSFCSLSPVPFTTLNHSCIFFSSKPPELVICVGISGLVAHPKASECYSLRNRVPTWNLCAKLRSNLITLEPDFSKMKMITLSPCL